MFVPLSQLPLTVTSVALGARRRKVTVRSGWISGERSGGSGLLRYERQAHAGDDRDGYQDANTELQGHVDLRCTLTTLRESGPDVRVFCE
jgi:hypothetical protein